jgi:hypothetical protein
MERHDLSELATRINALKADVVASAGSDGRSPALIIQAHRPNIKTLELRGEAEGVNLMGPPKLLTEKSAEARSEPIASLEAGSYCLSLGRRTYEVTFREKQKPEDVAKAINALNGYVKASAVDGPSCNECVLVLTAALPDLEPIKLLTDSGRTNLIGNTATRIGRLQAATDRISVQGPREYQLSVGTRTYETVKLGEKDEPSALANGLNKLLAGSDLTAEMTKASGEGCKDCYTLTLTGNVPDLRDLGFRKRIGATNLLGSVGSYYCVANLWNSWKGILTTWLLLILGTPFWYDILKNMLRLRPLLAREEEQERAQRQERR